MKIVVIYAALLALFGCTLFQKTQGNDEVEALTQDVLKKGIGIEIDVKPIKTP